MDKLEFWTICSANGIMLDKDQVDIFERFHRDLTYWNKQVNLISRKDEDNIWERHFLHSLSILSSMPVRDKAHVLDVGTGGGFPGIPMKIARQDLKMVLADSIAKKMKLTSMFAEHTGLHGITPLNVRVEDLNLQKQYHQAFDLVVARAVAPISEIIGWTRALLKPNGSYALLKGGDLEAEVNEARRAFPRIRAEVLPIRLRGLPWFEEQEKKIIIASFT